MEEGAMLYPRDPFGERAWRWTRRAGRPDGWIEIVARLIALIFLIFVVWYLTNHTHG